MATTPLMQMLQGYLKVASDRQQVVASNIANVDTPGYHTRDINFQSAMQQVMNEGNNMQLEPASVEVDGSAGAARRQQRQHRSREHAAFRDTTPISNGRATD